MGVSVHDHFSDEPEPNRPQCPKCGPGTTLRTAGFYRSRVDPDEVREKVRCTACKIYFTLPTGQRLPDKPREAPVVPVVTDEDAALDERPACPQCGSDHIWAKGTIGVYSKESWRDGRTPGGSQRWKCADCEKTFVTDPYQHTPAKEKEKEQLVDRRHSWNWHKGRQADDVKEEADALFLLACNESDFDGVRSLIVFSPMEQYVATYFCAAGLIAEMLMFRERVLEEFDSLVLRYRRPGKETASHGSQY